MRLILSLLCIAAASAPVRAQDGSVGASPFDPVRLEDTGVRGVACYVHSRYIVVEEELSNSLGADLYVRSSDSRNCLADSLAGDIVIRNEWAEYFSGIKGDALFLDSGSGPDLRQLIVLDLNGPRRILETSYVEVVAVTEESAVGIWDGYYLDAPAPGCDSPIGGLEPGVDSLFVFDATSGSLGFAGKTRCATRQ